MSELDDVGFGFGEFGSGLFGETDWAYHVLYTELPQRIVTQDQSEGGLYEKFVRAIALPINRLRRLINGFEESLKDPIKIREDLLEFYAASLGLDSDPELLIDYRRMRVAIWSRFRLIKGRDEAYIVLARIHGFDATVVPLWFNGTDYVITPPSISLELGPVVA